MAPLPAPLDRFHWRQAWAAAKQHPVGSPRRTSCWLGRCLCTRVAFPVSHLSRSSSLIAGWCHRFVRPPLALILSVFLSHVSFSTPLGSAVLSGLDVCATKRTGTNARTNSRCIVVSVCRKVTVQSASELRSYNDKLSNDKNCCNCSSFPKLFVPRVSYIFLKHFSKRNIYRYTVLAIFTNSSDVT